MLLSSNPHVVVDTPICHYLLFHFHNGFFGNFSVTWFENVFFFAKIPLIINRFFTSWLSSSMNFYSQFQWCNILAILKYATSHNHPQPATTIHNHPQPSTITHNHPQPATTIQNQPQSSTTIHNHPNQPQPGTTIHNQPQPSTATQKLPKKATTCYKRSCYCT